MLRVHMVVTPIRYKVGARFVVDSNMGEESKLSEEGGQ